MSRAPATMDGAGQPLCLPLCTMGLLVKTDTLRRSDGSSGSDTMPARCAPVCHSSPRLWALSYVILREDGTRLYVEYEHQQDVETHMCSQITPLHVCVCNSRKPVCQAPPGCLSSRACGQEQKKQTVAASSGGYRHDICPGGDLCSLFECCHV